jgi:transposase
MAAVQAASYWVGVDAGVASANLCIVDAHGNIVCESECSAKPADVAAALAAVPREAVEQVALEAGCSTYLTRKLRQIGYRVVVLESIKAQRLLRIRRNKSDINDARGLADIARLSGGALGEVHLKGLDCQCIRTRLRLRYKLIQHRMAAEGFMRSLIRLNGGQWPRTDTTRIRSRAEAAIAQIELSEGVDLSDEVLPLVEIAEGLRTHLKQTDAWLLKAARSHPVCSRFLEIPGVGPICALSFYSAVEDPWRFSRSTDVAAYLGLTPRLHQSGSTKRMLRITKMGNKLTRTNLVQAANALLMTRKKRVLSRNGAIRSQRGSA